MINPEITHAVIEIDLQLLLILGVVFLAGTLRGFMGFGSALLTVPALAVLFDPVQAVVIAMLLEIPVSLSLLPTAIKRSQPRTVLPMLSIFLIFIPVGVWLLRSVDPDLMKIIISVFVLIMVGVIFVQNRLAAILSPMGLILTGIIGGISQGLTGIAGPLFATAILARGESASQSRANIIALAGGVTLISLISFWVLGLLTQKAIVTVAVATVPMLLGVAGGSVLFRRLSHYNLRNVILVFLAVVAVVTLIPTL